MSEDKDTLFGRLAVEHGYVAQEQLGEAREAQAPGAGQASPCALRTGGGAGMIAIPLPRRAAVQFRLKQDNMER